MRFGLFPGQGRSEWGTLNGRWVSHEIRDAVVDYVHYWKERAETPAKQILQWIGLYESTFYKRCRSYGKEYQHNGAIPHDHWVEAWEREAIIQFYYEQPLNGYRRLTYMMLDRDIVAVSPATVYRALSAANLLGHRSTKT